MTRDRENFTGKALGWIIGISVGSFLVAFIMAAFGENIIEVRSAGADTFSYSALGHHALVELLVEQGIEVDVRRRPGETAFGPRVPLVVAEPPLRRKATTHPVHELWEEAFLANAPLVIILPKWSGVSGPQGKFVSSVELRDLPPINEALALFSNYVELSSQLRLERLDVSTAESCSGSWGAAYRVDLTSMQLLSPLDEQFTPVIDCPSGVLAARIGEDPPVFIVSDPDLFNNHGLIRGERAGLVHDLLREELGGEKLVFDETAHGFVKNSSLLSAMLSFPLVVTVLHGLLIVGLVLAAGVGRFGKPRRLWVQVVDGKQQLIDNAAQLLSIGGHGSVTLRRYFDQTLRAVGAHYFFPVDMPLDLLQGELQTISSSKGLEFDLDDFKQRIATRRTARRYSDRAVNLATRLHRWRRGMTDGIRSDP